MRVKGGHFLSTYMKIEIEKMKEWLNKKSKKTPKWVFGMKEIGKGPMQTEHVNPTA